MRLFTRSGLAAIIPVLLCALPAGAQQATGSDVAKLMGPYINKECSGAINSGTNWDTFFLKEGQVHVRHGYTSRTGTQEVEATVQEGPDGGAKMTNPNSGAVFVYHAVQGGQQLQVDYNNGRFLYGCGPIKP